MRMAVTTLHFPYALLPGGWATDVAIGVGGGKIVSIGANLPLTAGMDRQCGVAVPGVANVHSHAFQRAMAGLVETRGPEDDSFWTWREVMYRFLGAMTPDDIEAVAAWTYLEMLEAGFTAIGEFHYLHHQSNGQPYADIAETAGRIVNAAIATGIGLTLLPSFYAHGGCGGVAPKDGQKRFVNSPDSFARLMEASRRHIARHAGANLGIAPHSLRAVDAPELRALLAANPSGPVHIHAAEQLKEIDECIAWSGARPVAWLLDNAPVDARWCLIHATHMTAAETERLARSGAVAGLCPITEANLGDGVFNGTAFAARAGLFGIGSDSNVRISVAEELRQLETSQRLRDMKRNRLGPAGGSTGRFLFDTAAKGGARALGRDTGALAVGKSADIVALDTEHPALVGRSGDQILDAWVFASGDGVVRDVWTRGHHVVSGGRHRARAKLWPAFKRTVERLANAG
jgi:formimidoylglutamate deiminase